MLVAPSRPKTKSRVALLARVRSGALGHRRARRRRRGRRVGAEPIHLASRPTNMTPASPACAREAGVRRRVVRVSPPSPPTLALRRRRRRQTAPPGRAKARERLCSHHGDASLVASHSMETVSARGFAVATGIVLKRRTYAWATGIRPCGSDVALPTMENPRTCRELGRDDTRLHRRRSTSADRSRPALLQLRARRQERLAHPVGAHTARRLPPLPDRPHDERPRLCPL